MASAAAARQRATAASALQWHYQGYAPVLLTNHRLILVTEPDSASIRLADLDWPAGGDPNATRMNLDSPFGSIALDDPWIAYLMVALEEAAAGGVAARSGHRLNPQARPALPDRPRRLSATFVGRD